MFFSKPILAQALAALLLSTPTFAAVVKSDIDASPSQRTDQGLCDMLASAGLINLDRHGCEHSTSDIDADPEFKASVCSALYHGGLTGLDSIGCGVEHIHHGLLLERKDDRNGKGTSGHGPHIRARNLKHHGHHRKHPYHHHGGGGSTGGGSSNPAPPPPQPQPQPPTLPPPQCSLTKFCSVTQNSLIWNSANNVCNSYYAPPGAPAPPPAPAPAPAPQPSAAGLFPPFEGYGGSASAFQARQAAAAATPCNNTDICKIMQTGLFNTATLGCNYSGVGA